MTNKRHQILQQYSPLYEIVNPERFELFVSGKIDKAFYELRHSLEINLSPSSNADMKYGTVSFYRFTLKNKWEKIYPHRVLNTSIDTPVESIIEVIKKSKGFFKRLILETDCVSPQHIPSLMKLSIYINPKAIHILLCNPSAEKIIKSINLCSQIGISLHIEGNFDIESYLHYLRASRVKIFPYISIFYQILQGLFNTKTTYQSFSIDIPPAISWLISNRYPGELTKMTTEFLTTISISELKEALIKYIETFYQTDKLNKYIENLCTQIETANLENLTVENKWEYKPFSSLKDFCHTKKLYPFILIENSNINTRYFPTVRGFGICVRNIALVTSSKNLEKTIKKIENIKGLPIYLGIKEKNFNNFKEAVEISQKNNWPIILIGLKNLSTQEIKELANMYLHKDFNSSVEIVPFSKALQETCSLSIGIKQKYPPFENLYKELGNNYKEEINICKEAIKEIPYIKTPIKKFESEILKAKQEE